jgi:hypothetical protein
MKIVECREHLICVALAALSLCLIGGFVLIERVPAIIHSEAEATRNMLVAQTTLAIDDAKGSITDAILEADFQITAALKEVHLASVNADKRTGQALDIVRQTQLGTGTGINRIGQEIHAQMSTLNETVATTLKPVGEAAQQVNEAAPLWLDCEFNPDCAFNRYQGAAKAFEHTAIVIAAAAPSLVSSADKIAASSVDTSVAVAATGKEVAIAAHRFNAPQTKWQAFRSWLVTAARIAGNL